MASAADPSTLDSTSADRFAFGRDILIPALVFAALAVATLVPLWQAPGWPISHEGDAFALRTYVYRQHMNNFDLLPIWSSIDASGFGSPMPLLYHKLFYLVAGVLALGTDSLKLADAATVALFLVVGAAGVYATVRVIGGSRAGAIVAGCSLVAANYTVTNWLVRGALAEFSGAMLVPWVLFFFVQSVRTGRVKTGFGFALGLLWLGHSVLAFYTGLLLGITYLVLAGARLAPWSVLDPRRAWTALLGFSVLVGPYLAAMAIVGGNYDFQRILTPPFRPTYQFRPFTAYLWEQHWRWGRTIAGLTVQLDHAMLALLAVSGWALAAKRAPQLAGDRRATLRAVLPFLLLAALGLTLQLRFAAPFYDKVPGAAFLQFPWRLLAIVTPSLIVAAVFLADRVLPRDPRMFGLGAAAAWMVVACGAFAPLRDPRVPLEPRLAALSFSGFREYEPKSAAPLGEVQTRLAARWADAGCFLERHTQEEASVVVLRTSCGRAAVLPLPIYASPLHSVRTSLHDRQQRCLTMPEFPALCVAAIPAATAEVMVILPRMGRIPQWVWQRLTRASN